MATNLEIVRNHIELLQDTGWDIRSCPGWVLAGIEGVVVRLGRPASLPGHVRKACQPIGIAAAHRPLFLEGLVGRKNLLDWLEVDRGAPAVFGLGGLQWDARSLCQGVRAVRLGLGGLPVGPGLINVGRIRFTDFSPGLGAHAQALVLEASQWRVAVSPHWEPTADDRLHPPIPFVGEHCDANETDTGGGFPAASRTGDRLAEGEQA